MMKEDIDIVETIELFGSRNVNKNKKIITGDQGKNAKNLTCVLSCHKKKWSKINFRS